MEKKAVRLFMSLGKMAELMSLLRSIKTGKRYLLIYNQEKQMWQIIPIRQNRIEFCIAGLTI